MNDRPAPAQRAAIYARYPVDPQGEQSIDDQVALCQEFSERRGYIVVATYADRTPAPPGADSLSSLADHAESGAFEAIVVEAPDRISSSPEGLLLYYRLFNQLGIPLIAVHDEAGASFLAVIGSGSRRRSRRPTAAAPRPAHMAPPQKRGADEEVTMADIEAALDKLALHMARCPDGGASVACIYERLEQELADRMRLNDTLHAAAARARRLTAAGRP